MHPLRFATRLAGGKGGLRAVVTLGALALGGNVAFAGEGQGGPFDVTGTATTAYGTVAAGPDVGSEAYPSHAGGVNVAVLPGNLLPAATDTAPDTANSLPAGFASGTEAWARAEQLKNWFAAQRAATHMLAGTRLQPKG